MREGFLFYVHEGMVGRLFHGIIIVKGSLIGGRGGGPSNGGRLEKPELLPLSPGQRPFQRTSPVSQAHVFRRTVKDYINFLSPIYT
jgi:hypothetical protein